MSKTFWPIVYKMGQGFLDTQCLSLHEHHLCCFSAWIRITNISGSWSLAAKLPDPGPRPHTENRLNPIRIQIHIKVKIWIWARIRIYLKRIHNTNTRIWSYMSNNIKKNQVQELNPYTKRWNRLPDPERNFNDISFKPRLNPIRIQIHIRVKIRILARIRINLKRSKRQES